MKLGDLYRELGRLLETGESEEAEVLLDLPGECITVYLDGGIVVAATNGAREICLLGYSVVGEETSEE